MSEALVGAVRLLSRREHGAHELHHKLAKKGHIDSEIQAALEECQRLGLQSDSRFVENVCRTRIRQGYGPVRIRQELKQLKIDSELIDTALSQGPDEWLSHALQVWQKKYKEPREDAHAKQQQQKQFLLYRGFSTEIINSLFKNLPLITLNDVYHEK